MMRLDRAHPSLDTALKPQARFQIYAASVALRFTLERPARVDEREDAVAERHRTEWCGRIAPIARDRKVPSHLPPIPDKASHQGPGVPVVRASGRTS